MSMTKKSLGFGSILALFVANALVFAGGPRAASAGGSGCDEECYCFGSTCNEEEFGFDQCEPGFHWVTYNDETKHILDPIYNSSGQLTHTSCGEGN